MKKREKKEMKRVNGVSKNSKGELLVKWRKKRKSKK